MIRDVNLSRPLGKAKSGEMIYDRKNSHMVLTILPLLPEALGKLDLTSVKNGEIVTLTHDFGRVIGHNICVETSGDDIIVWAQRPGRRGLTRLVKNRQPEETSSLTIALKKDDSEGYFVVLTSYIGGRSGLEPWDQRATDDDKLFWANHALIYELTQIVPGTETNACSW